MIQIPILEWFAGNVFSNKGNRYVGSVGATAISANAFCYQVWLERNEQGELLKAQAYDVLSKSEPEKYEQAEFPANEEGRNQVEEWLNAAYQRYLDNGRDALTVEF